MGYRQRPQILGKATAALSTKVDQRSGMCLGPVSFTPVVQVYVDLLGNRRASVVQGPAKTIGSYVRVGMTIRSEEGAAPFQEAVDLVQVRHIFVALEPRANDPTLLEPNFSINIPAQALSQRVPVKVHNLLSP